MASANPSKPTVGANPASAATGQHPVFARVWSRMSGSVGSDKQRTELLAGLSGRVLEVGAGDGRNFALYPTAVSEVVAVEPEPYLRRLADVAARTAPVAVTVLDGTAERLPLDAGVFDGAISSLVLCSVPDQSVALAQMHRALVVGGELRFFEHVIAHHSLGSTVQRRLDSSGVWPRLGAGCHLSRDTLAAIEEAGFTIERVRRFSNGRGPLGLPFVLGCARRAAAPDEDSSAWSASASRA